MQSLFMVTITSVSQVSFQVRKGIIPPGFFILISKFSTSLKLLIAYSSYYIPPASRRLLSAREFVVFGFQYSLIFSVYPFICASNSTCFLLTFLLFTTFFSFCSSYLGSSIIFSFVVTAPAFGCLSPVSRFCSLEAQHALPMVANNILLREII